MKVTHSRSPLSTFPPQTTDVPRAESVRDIRTAEQIALDRLFELKNRLHRAFEAEGLHILIDRHRDEYREIVRTLRQSLDMGV